jgi:hypothetical protein
MIEGDQFVDISEGTNELVPIPQMYWWEERKVYNQIGPIVDTRIAKLSRIRPLLKTRPSGTNQPDDIRKTKVSNQLLKDLQYNKNMMSKIVECYFWSESTGTAVMKNPWNPNKGKVVAMDQQQGQDGGQTEKAVREGDPDPIVCSPFEIYPDSCYHQNIEDCRSMIHAKAFHVDAVQEMWNQKVDPEEAVVTQLKKNELGLGGLGGNRVGFSFTTAKLENNALVKEYSEIPTSKYPQGRLIISASKKLLHYGPLPFPVGDDNELAIPFVKAECIKRIGCFWGKTVVERLIPVQRSFNALENRIEEHLNRVGIGQWTVEQNSMDDMDTFESEASAPGAIHEYKKGFAKPEPVSFPSLPPDFEFKRRALLQQFSMISGVSEMSRQSQAPPGVKSGVALSIALDQDDTRLATTAQNYESFYVCNGKQWLRLYKAFVQGYRLLNSVGKNNIVDVMEWQSSDVSSDDVMIEAGTANSESLAQRRQMVFDMINSPLLTDPDTGKIDKQKQAKLLEMIEFGNWEDYTEDSDLHIQKAERENKGIEQGQQPRFVPYDDHIIHIPRHNKHRLTVEWEELVSQNPMLEQIMQMHVEQHLAAMQPMIQPEQMPETEQPQSKTA